MKQKYSEHHDGWKRVSWVVNFPLWHHMYIKSLTYTSDQFWNLFSVIQVVVHRMNSREKVVTLSTLCFYFSLHWGIHSLYSHAQDSTAELPGYVLWLSCKSQLKHCPFFKEIAAVCNIFNANKQKYFEAISFPSQVFAMETLKQPVRERERIMSNKLTVYFCNSKL